MFSFFVLFFTLFFFSWRNSINVRKVCMYTKEIIPTLHARAIFLFLFLFLFLSSSSSFYKKRKKREKREENS